jgi:hypothetical protein
VRYEINPGVADDWPELIGKLILNFAAIELATIRWIIHLTKDGSQIAALAKVRFRDRMSRVTAVLAAPGLDPTFVAAATETWREAQDLADTRNRVAHNPIVFGWYGPVQGPPDFLGLPDFKAPIQADQASEVLIDRVGLIAAADQAAQIAMRLDTQLHAHLESVG